MGSCLLVFSIFGRKNWSLSLLLAWRACFFFFFFFLYSCLIFLHFCIFASHSCFVKVRGGGGLVNLFSCFLYFGVVCLFIKPEGLFVCPLFFLSGLFWLKPIYYHLLPQDLAKILQKFQTSFARNLSCH